MRLAGVFLREHLPPEVAKLLGSEDPTPGESEFIDNDLRRLLLDKVLCMALIGGTTILFVLDGKSTKHWLDVAQQTSYCTAIFNNWYRQELEKESARPRPAPKQSPAVIAVIVHSGPSQIFSRRQADRAC